MVMTIKRSATSYCIVSQRACCMLEARPLTRKVEEPTNVANTTKHHGRGIGLGLSVGLGVGSFRVGASLALGHRSRLTTSSKLASSEGRPGISMTSISKKMSGFISITRSGTGTDVGVKNSISTFPPRQTGLSTIPTSRMSSIPTPYIDGGQFDAHSTRELRCPRPEQFWKSC
jgi:hypothetical protein